MQANPIAVSNGFVCTLDRDIWTAADQMIAAFGPDAVWRASLRAKQRWAEGNNAYGKVWNDITAAVEELQKQNPGRLARH